MEILDNLNEEQRKPAETVDGPILVTAGAGSGKTRMLTHRVAHLVTDLKVNPNHILAITFTNKAANEMKERLSKMIDDIGDMWVCTFHAMCSRILRSHASEIGFSKSFSIYGDTEKSRVIKRILEKNETDMNAETFAWHISNAKNNLMSPEEYSKYIHDKKKCEIITRVYALYEKELFASNALDFDDLLVKTYELFEKCPETLEYYQNRFEYVFVDEFQDTNTAQYKIVKKIAEKRNNICVVGDEDQCIYSWRGAQVENIKRFIKDFDGCKVFKLEQNYRSSKTIVETANKLIKNNTNRIVKTLWTSNDDGEKIECFETYSDIDEAEKVAEKIEYLTKELGYKYSDFAVLMRVNSLSRLVEEKLLTYNIPYKIYGGFKFFERKEIKDTVSYLHLVTNPNDNDAVLRALAFPKKGIGDVSIENLLQIAQDNEISLMEVIENAEKYGVKTALAGKLKTFSDLILNLKEKSEQMTLEEFADYAIKEAGIKEAIGTKTEDDVNKCMNVDDFVKSVSEFASVNENATIDDFLQSITLMRDIDQMSEEDDFVSLITVHAAKGLEFNTVFIIGLNDGLFPLSRAINSNDPNELEEERRLMYVAITRARKKLFMSRSKTKFNFDTKRTDPTVASRFLEEAIDGYKKQQKNSAVSKSNIFDTGFDSFLDSYSSKESLDQKMSSHINIVNVSKADSGTERESSNSFAEIKTADYSKFKKGTRVKHQHFGEGEVTLGVTDFASAFVTIKFDTVGIKTLSLKYAKLEIIE